MALIFRRLLVNCNVAFEDGDQSEELLKASKPAPLVRERLYQFDEIPMTSSKNLLIKLAIDEGMK